MQSITRVRVLLSTVDRHLDNHVEVTVSTTSNTAGFAAFGQIGINNGVKFLDPIPSEVIVAPASLGGG